jgi:hypothetical protein
MSPDSRDQADNILGSPQAFFDYSRHLAERHQHTPKNFPDYTKKANSSAAS